MKELIKSPEGAEEDLDLTCRRPREPGPDPVRTLGDGDTEAVAAAPDWKIIAHDRKQLFCGPVGIACTCPLWADGQAAV